jgi:hypothetical protein
MKVLVVIGAVLVRDDEAVGDDVVDEGHAHRPGIAEVMRLHGRRPQGENSGAPFARVAVEVDDDVDFQLAQGRGDHGIAPGLQIDEAVERSLDAPPHLAFIVWPQRNRRRLEARPVVMLEAADDHFRHHMIAEIRREIGDPQLVVAIAFAAP